MIKQTFCDGISQIHFAGNMIRFDLVQIVPNPTDPEHPETEIFERLVMNPQAFVNTYQSMQQLIQKMVDNKILTEFPGAPKTGETVKVEKVNEK